MAEALRTIGEVPSLDIGLGRLAAFTLRMRVWWSKDILTRRLAHGAASVESRQLALRAGQIAAKHTRSVVASSLEELVQQAGRNPPLFGSRVPLNRDKIVAVSDRLLELAERVRMPEPVSTEGMARLLILLTDPEQPLYGLDGPAELAHAIIDVRTRLDEPFADDWS
jgi:hypothetical protein